MYSSGEGLAGMSYIQGTEFSDSWAGADLMLTPTAHIARLHFMESASSTVQAIRLDA